MAPKKRPPPPAAVEEESGSSGEETSSSADKGEDKSLPLTQARKAKSKRNPPTDDEAEDEEEQEKNPKANGSEENSESGSESEEEENKEKSDKMEESGSSDESDSDTEDKFIAAVRPPRGPDRSIKPINSRPMDGSTTSRIKASSSSPAVSTPSSSKLENGDGKKRKLFERVWSDDAEEKILRGMINFYDSQGKELPTSKTDIDGICEFLKSSFGSGEFSKSQLASKIHRLKTKFRSTFTKHGESPKFTKPMDQKNFELSKKIWGPKENGTVNDAGSDDNDSDEELGELDASPIPLKHRNSKTGTPLVDIAETYPNVFNAYTSEGMMKLPEAFARRVLSGMDSAKLAKLEEKLRKHKIVATKHQLHWLDLMKETTQLVIEFGDISDAFRR